MKIFALVIMVLLALLSIAAGAAKITHAPEEVAFFSEVGLDAFWLAPLGGLQVGSALACAIARLRRAGLAGVALGFAISSAMIFMAGNTVFGALSLIPAALALWLLSRQPRPVKG